MTEFDPEVEALLAAARGADDPEPEARRRVRAALAVQLGAAAFGTSMLGVSSSAAATGAAGAAGAEGAGAALGATTATGATAVAKGAAGLAGAKLWIVCGVIGATGVGAVGVELSRPPKPPAEVTVHIAHEAASTVESRTLDEAPATAAPTTEASPPTPVATRPVRAAPVEVAPVEPAARRVNVRSQGGPQPVPPEAPTPAPAEPSWQVELQMLKAAQLALRAGELERALQLAMEHAQRFPQGKLRRERWAVMALARCGRGQDGGAAARDLDREAPGSALSERVRRACER